MPEKALSEKLMREKAILLVEDNPNDAELAMLAFKKNNFPTKIILARDGVEALDYLFGTGAYSDRNIEEKPKLILLDLKLPKIDGLEVLRTIRSDERTRYIPVVVLTSSKEQRDLTEAYRLCVNAYVRKPIDFAEFTETVRQLDSFWLLLNEQPP
ncbi:MAG TPA: response regulator [Oculatellaceae cyanobacterium]